MMIKGKKVKNTEVRRCEGETVRTYATTVA